ncbi:MAG TPA: sigma 54-interacting transcriptional regulator, partial [Thermoanaerobaculia bacterium]|nr:sigma 54-interacting transcriptional regulator [Thermoanaerobaculia bacterium]
HEPGAYTDAKARRRGLFELADGGTLFFDEVADLPRELQPKLLRVIEGHPFRRVGGEREVSVDVRVVSASNRPLSREVEAGAFRADLYQRLRVLEIELPPLRDRGDDVLELALFFFRRLAAEMGLPQPALSPAVLECLAAYSWPGNVRELRNVIERALVLAADREVTPADLPPEVTAAARATLRAAPSPPAPTKAGYTSLDEAVRRHILAVYENRGRNLSQTARTLGISRVALRRKLRRYGSI